MLFETTHMKHFSMGQPAIHTWKVTSQLASTNEHTSAGKKNLANWTCCEVNNENNTPYHYDVRDTGGVAKTAGVCKRSENRAVCCFSVSSVKNGNISPFNIKFAY